MGNPGKKYEKTRHNIGYMVIDNYLENADWKEKFNALYFKKSINGEIVYFIKPLTYMNLSGDSVVQYVNYFNISIKDILVIQDDLDQEIGNYKLKKNSSSGGHNGINSIISVLNSMEFARLKIGIKNEYLDDTIDFVLGKFSKQDLSIINDKMPEFKKIIDLFIKNGISKTLDIYKRK